MPNHLQNKGSAVAAKIINGPVTVSSTFYAVPMTSREPKHIRMNVFNPDIGFVGRLDELERLENEARYELTGHQPQITVVCGLGGIGKTQLVRRFIEKKQSSFEHIVWIESQERASMEDTIKKLANELQFTIETDDINFVIEKVFNELSTTESLIVFDNVDDKANVEFVFKLATFSQSLRIVITTRLQRWGDSIDIIKLAGLNPTDAKTFVSTTLDMDPDDRYTEELIDTLQYFPLALRQATAYIKFERQERNPNFTIADYIKHYNSERLLNSKIFQQDLRNSYTETTFTTWGVTMRAFERLGADGKLALRILYVMAFFHPDRIRTNIFFHLTQNDQPFRWKKLSLCLSSLFCHSPFNRVNQQETEDNVRSAIRLLVDYSMVTKVEHEQGQSTSSTDYVTIHRLVQQVLKINLDNIGKTERILRDGLTLISEKIRVGECDDLIDHAISVFLPSLSFEKLQRDFQSLPADIVDSGIDIKEIECRGEILLLLHGLTGGADDSDTVTSMDAIASSYIDFVNQRTKKTLETTN